MLFDVPCLLFVVCYLLLLFAVRRVSLVVCGVLLVICWWLGVCLLLDCLLIAVRWLLFCRSYCVACCMLLCWCLLLFVD